MIWTSNHMSLCDSKIKSTPNTVLTDTTWFVCDRLIGRASRLYFELLVLLRLLFTFLQPDSLNFIGALLSFRRWRASSFDTGVFVRSRFGVVFHQGGRVAQYKFKA